MNPGASACLCVFCGLGGDLERVSKVVRHHLLDLNLIPVVASDARDIGECIYCGVRDQPLRREHAVPYGLNGPWTLLRTSCDDCARITHKFERDTMRSLWPTVRNAPAMQTRRSKERSATLPLVVVRDGMRETIQVPKERYPVYLPPLFPAPGAVSGRPLQRGVFRTSKPCTWQGLIQSSRAIMPNRRLSGPRSTMGKCVRPASAIRWTIKRRG